MPTQPLRQRHSTLKRSYYSPEFPVLLFPFFFSFVFASACGEGERDVSFVAKFSRSEAPTPGYTLVFNCPLTPSSSLRSGSHFFMFRLARQKDFSLYPAWLVMLACPLHLGFHQPFNYLSLFLFPRSFSHEGVLQVTSLFLLREVPPPDSVSLSASSFFALFGSTLSPLFFFPPRHTRHVFCFFPDS